MRGILRDKPMDDNPNDDKQNKSFGSLKSLDATACFNQQNLIKVPKVFKPSIENVYKTLGTSITYNPIFPPSL